MNNNWEPFTANYRKAFYEVELPDGTRVQNCWPNAGGMRVKGRRYLPQDGLKVRCQPYYQEPDTPTKREDAA